MIETKAIIGKMNLDDSPERLPKEDVLYSLNTTIDSIGASSDLVRTNIVGNRLVNYTLPAGTNTCIGAYPFTVRNTVIYFVWNSNGNHSILEYNDVTRSVSKIFVNLTDSGGVDVLSFTQQGKIHSVNTFVRSEGDLLFFLDSLGRPTKLDIAKFKAGEYTPVTRDILDLHVKPPLTPPKSVYANDTTRRVNNLRNRLFRFCYRYVYDDFSKSTCSPIGELSLPVSILDDTFTSVVTNNNVISVSLDSGDKNVRDIELLMSYVEKNNDWTDFVLVEAINKQTRSLSDNVQFSFNFYNDSVYPAVDPQEVILPFDYVPELANAMEMPNGNVLMFSGITEGLNKEITPNVVNTISTYPVGASAGGSLTAVTTRRTPNMLFWRWDTQFSGVPPVGTVVEIKIRRTSTGLEEVAATYTTVLGDTVGSIAFGLAASMNVINKADVDLVTGAGYIRYEFRTFDYDDFATTIVNAPTSSAASNSSPCFKWSTERNIGIAYFDKKGRTNGILYNAKVTFPAYAENVSNQVLLPKITTQVFHRPPTWAHSYQFYFTKENTQYLFWITNSVNVSESDFIYLEVTGIDFNATKNPTTSTVLSYTFQEGDRLRLIKKAGATTFFNDTYDAAIIGLVANPVINGVAQTDKKFVKIRKTAPFSNATFPDLTNYLIEIYRPEQQSASGSNQVYFECGKQFPILEPGTSNRRHAGETTEQSADLVTPATIEFTKGDAYYRLRVMSLSQSSVFTNGIVDRNFVDVYPSAVNSISGRPSIIDVNARREYFPTLTRFGQAYQLNTNVNGINRFYPNNFQEYDMQYGDVVRLKVRDRAVRVFQKFKVGVVPLFNQISKNADGATLNVVTDKLLNPIQYYVGDFGIGEHATSLASFNYADYFTTNIRGVVARVSNDGVEPLSIRYKMNAWAIAELPKRSGNSKVYGGFDPRTNNYVLALEAATGSAAQTLAYDEENNGFESFLSYQPEMMVTLGMQFITFKNGQLYTHDSETYNNFYGVQYRSFLTLCFNQSPNQTKVYQSLEYRADKIWYCTELRTSMYSFGSTLQNSEIPKSAFRRLEDRTAAPVYRDKNTSGGLANGQPMRGGHAIVSLLLDPSDANAPTKLNFVSLKSIDSAFNNR